MLRQRPVSGQQLRSSLELILRQADSAQRNGCPDEVSSLVDIVYAIYDSDCELLH